MIVPFRPKNTALVPLDYRIGTMQLVKTLDVSDVHGNEKVAPSSRRSSRIENRLASRRRALCQ